MTAAPNLEVSANLGHKSIHLDGITRPRAQVVERDAHLPSRGDHVAMRTEQIGQLTEHAQHFALLGSFRRAQLVAQLDDLMRLDKDRRARRGFVVDDAAHTRACRAANWNHIPAAAYRHGSVRGALGRIEGTEDGAESVHDVRSEE